MGIKGTPAERQGATSPFANIDRTIGIRERAGGPKSSHST
jgi:hypothetical protein